jgi:hypothetical protein
MGNKRGGLYSYDWLDTHLGPLEQPSVDRLLPEFQNLQEGDLLPYAKGTDMLVRRLVPNRELLLWYSGPTLELTQSWGLYPRDASHTRLVIRVRATLPAHVRPGVVERLKFTLIELTEFPMTRRQLLGIKSRAEGLARANAEASFHE